MPTKQNICSFNINNFRDDKNFPPHSINGRGRGELRSRCFQFHPLPLYFINNNNFNYVCIKVICFVFFSPDKQMLFH